jgi:hypothetical protein
MILFSPSCNSENARTPTKFDRFKFPAEMHKSRDFSTNNMIPGNSVIAPSVEASILLQDLPCDILLRAMSSMDHFTLSAFGRTCRPLQVLSKDISLWRGIFGRTVPCRSAFDDSLDWQGLFKRVICHWRPGILASEDGAVTDEPAEHSAVDASSGSSHSEEDTVSLHTHCSRNRAEACCQLLWPLLPPPPRPPSPQSGEVEE